MNRYERRIENIEKRIPEQDSELEEIKQELEKENPGYDFLVGIQNGIVSYVQLPKRLTPEEWMKKYHQDFTD
jgi:sugar-specific transcriptional regulator TrmB